MFNDIIIDEIELLRNESELNVMEAMLQTYDKMAVIMENCEDTDIDCFSIYQESKTKNKNDESMFKKIMLFIPRLIASIFKAIRNAFTKSKKQEEKHPIKKAIDVSSDVVSSITRGVQTGVVCVGATGLIYIGIKEFVKFERDGFNSFKGIIHSRKDEVNPETFRKMYNDYNHYCREFINVDEIHKLVNVGMNTDDHNIIIKTFNIQKFGSTVTKELSMIFRKCSGLDAKAGSKIQEYINGTSGVSKGMNKKYQYETFIDKFLFDIYGKSSITNWDSYIEDREKPYTTEEFYDETNTFLNYISNPAFEKQVTDSIADVCCTLRNISKNVAVIDDKDKDGNVKRKNLSSSYSDEILDRYSKYLSQLITNIIYDTTKFIIGIRDECASQIHKLTEELEKKKVEEEEKNDKNDSDSEKK